MASGKMDAYDNAIEEWSSYAERCEQFCIANDIGDEKNMVATLLSSMGPTAYKDLKDLITPAKPSSLKFTEIDTKLTKRYDPETTIILERYRFHTRMQKESETIIMFIAAIRRQAGKCEFKTFLDEALRDRLVCGLKHESIQKRLLGESKLTFETAQKMALGMEAASHNCSEMQGKQEPIHKMMATPVHGGRVCYCCGAPGHIKPDCPYKNYECGKCGRSGHLRKVCRSGQQPSGSQQEYQQNRSSGNRGRGSGGRGRDSNRGSADKDRSLGGREFRQNQRTQYMATESDNGDGASGEQGTQYLSADSDYHNSDYRETDDDYDIDRLYHVESSVKEDPPIVVKVLAHGKLLDMEIDTGAWKSIISEKVYKATWGNTGPQLAETTSILKTYTGERVEPLGEIYVNVNHNGQQKTLPLM
jgi:hypothetical protein